MPADNQSLGQAIPARDGKIWILVALAAIVFLGASLVRTINVPWVEDDNVFGAAHAQAARNNLRAGFSVTAGVPATLYVGPVPIPAEAYYVHHPVLFPLLVTASVAAFGEKEWTVKLVPIVCSIVSAFFLWLLVQKALGRRAAALVVAVFVTLPMELHYGDLVDYEPGLVMWMLAALICLRNWDLSRSSLWSTLAALCCLGALWTDWPGYLFTTAVAIWLLLKRQKQSGTFAIVLVALGLTSGFLFLLQICHVNPAAGRDLWMSLTLRLGTGVQPGSSPTGFVNRVHFGFWDWFCRILQGLDQDYLRVTWPLLVLGGIYLYRHRKAAGPLWVSTAVLCIVATGIPYLVMLRNWSFVHDFASFSMIGAIAILAGLGLEAVWQWTEDGPKFPRTIVALVTALFLPTLAWAGFNRAEEQRSQFRILDGASAEPANLIRDLGRYLATIFPADTTILCNFDPYYSPLSYYAQRTILRNLATPEEWEFALEKGDKRFGGIVWLDAPSTEEILATLPAGETSEVKIDGVRFAIWRGSMR
jgi:hypothetical protein